MRRGRALTRVLIVCVENANRSQIAEAFANRDGRGLLLAASAGSRPSGRVNPRAVAAMRERGYDLSGRDSKSLSSVGPGPWDYMITMGCGDECPWLSAAHREDWPLADPRELPTAAFHAIRDEIERRVVDLVERVRIERAFPNYTDDSRSLST